MRFAVVCNKTVYIGGWFSKSDAYDWAARNLLFEFDVLQLIDSRDLQ